MSTYYFKNKNNREVQYGLDKPTGGYYCQEYADGERDDLVTYWEGLTFTELEVVLKYNFEFVLSREIFSELVYGFISESNPTPLQYNMASMFGKNLSELLMRTRNDLVDRFLFENRSEL